MRRNPAATQSNNLAAILQYEDELNLYLIDVNSQKVVGVLAMRDSDGPSNIFMPYVALSASSKDSSGYSYGPLLYMLAIQFASDPQYFKKYIRDYDEGLDQEIEEMHAPPDEEPNFILMNIDNNPIGLRPDSVPSPSAAKLWTRILSDSDAYILDSSIKSSSLIGYGRQNEVHSDPRSSLNHAYKLVGAIYINGVEVDLEKALILGFQRYKGSFDWHSQDPIIQKVYGTASPMITEAVSSLARLDPHIRNYPTSFTVPS